MQAYTELVAPSAVTHSLSLPLTSATANNLVVAKGSLLQIFTTKTVTAEFDANVGDSTVQSKAEQPFDPRVNDDNGLESSFLGGETMLVKADKAQLTKLVLVAEIPLAGTVIGLARLKLNNTMSGGEALLLAYKAAKMCLAEWDPVKNILETISIHYYEKDELHGAPWEMPFGEYESFLEADPGSRCAAFKFGSRNLAILPFKQSEDDLEMDDWDEDLDGPRPAKESQAVVNGDSDKVEAAYTPSFVLRLPLLDPTLLHPVHFAFLHEYREPTFGIISPTHAPSASLGVKDQLTYKVFTLDLQQRASTTILSVTGLPEDLFRVVALPAPIGGALLVGQNELIHIDQSGKPNGVAVNAMTKQMTSFSLTDQSELNLRLENCKIEPLSTETGEMLLVLHDGSMGIVSFKIDGRTVTGLNVKLVASENGGKCIKSMVSCMSRLSKNALFVGSEYSDSLVIGWSRKQTQEKRRKQRSVDADLALDVDDLDLEEEEDDDDDLYADDSAAAKPAQAVNGSAGKGEITFRQHDSLFSLAPIRDFTSGSPAIPADEEEARLKEGVSAPLELACAVGKDGAGAMAIINRQIQPKVIGRFEFPEARGFWTMSVTKPLPKALGNSAVTADDYDGSGQYDRFMIVAKVDLDGYETSDVYALTGAGFETLKDTEFEPAAGLTVEAGTIGKHTRVVQVLKSEMRCYDGDLGLTQILPMLDEETGAEPRITSASIADPYLLLLRDDSSIFLAQVDNSYELEEVEKTDPALQSTKWVASCLYTDTNGTFQPIQGDKGAEISSKVMMFLLSATGALHIYALPDLSKPVFVAEGLSYVPPFLSADYSVRRGTPRDGLKEILVADLGDSTSQTPYLILRNMSNDLTFYEPVRVQDASDLTLKGSLVFKKSFNSSLASTPAETQDEDDSQDTRFVPLRTCANVGGYSAVFLPGSSPSFVLKSSKSLPRVIGLQGLDVRGMSTFHTGGCERGFIYADSEGVARVTQLPSGTNFTELGMSVRKIPLNTDVGKVAYHQPTGCYVAGCSVMEPFELPKDDDYHKEWAKETLSFPPMMPRGQLKLINPFTWTVIYTLDLESCESVESMKTLNLEVSEETKERRMLIALGSAITKGEDLPTRGRVQVFDIVTVIPEPDRPETNKRLKLIAKEEIPRGGVTAISEIGSQGLMLVAQGQKCMVRGLKEDESLLPVAFLDMSCHVVSAKELPGTGLCLMADAFKGVWFAGYTEEPYTFKVLGKSGGRIPILTADFLPDGDDMSIVAADADGDLHFLEFNPDHPKSLQGHLLLHRTSFSVTPNTPTSTMLLPRTPPSHTNPQSSSTPHTLLLASPSGSLSALTPLAESTYRRMLSVTNQLITTLVPHAGLNPRAYRLPAGAGGFSGVLPSRAASAAVGVETASGRVVVDGSVLARWTEVGAGKRAEMAGKGGYDGVGEMREELEGVLGWSGLNYF